MEENEPRGTYTDEQGVHELTIIARDPSIKFNFLVDETDTLVDVEFDGVRAVNAPISFYQDIIDFCERKIKEIPHYDVVDGKLEWNEGERNK